MPINPLIPMSVNPLQIQQPDPNSGMNALARMMQVGGMMDEQKMNALKFQELQRGVTENNSVNEAWRSAVGADGTIDRPKLFNSLATGGLGSRIPAVQKQILEADKARFDTQKAAFEGYKNFQLTLGSHANNPNLTKQEVLGSVGALVQSGSFDGPTAEKLVANLPDDPQQLRASLLQLLKSQLAPEQMLTIFAPKPTEVDNGQQKFFRDTNPNSPTYGQVTAGAPVQKVMSPGEVASDQRTRSEGALNRGVTQRGQDLTNQRSIDQNNIQSGHRTQQGVIELRKEFNALPEVKNFKEVLPIIQSVQRAPDTPAGDIDLIYGVGKIMDPNSVVREGEMTLVIKSGSPAQRLQGYVSYVQGGGRLSPGQRQELMAVMESRVQGLKSNYDAARATFETAADRQGLPKDQIFIDNSGPPQKPTPQGPSPAQRLPSNPTAATLQRGSVYELPNGKAARWNGQAFEVVQ
jgi:hypothetical protein